MYLTEIITQIHIVNATYKLLIFDRNSSLKMCN